MNKRQKRMANLIRHFQKYVQTYSPEDNADLSDDGFIKDMLYGVGISLDSGYQFADGFDRFMERIGELAAATPKRDTPTVSEQL